MSTGSSGRPELPPEVLELLGEGDFRAADEGAWAVPERHLGFGLPADFKLGQVKTQGDAGNGKASATVSGVQFD